jgi:hypothetical protein
LNAATMDMTFHVEQRITPKRRMRSESRATDQTKWIMDATSEWWVHYGEGPARLLGVPTENVLYRAALLIPRHPGGQVVLPDPSAIAAAVEKARQSVRASRWRVLVAHERHCSREIEFIARRLGMSVASTRDYLKEGRQALADVLRGMGWLVPIND